MNVAKLQQTLALANAAMEDKRISLSLSRMTVVQGRPRLRDRVASVLKTDERKAQVRPKPASAWRVAPMTPGRGRWTLCWIRGSRTPVSATSTSFHPH